jgi:hypothetical protein
VSEELIAQLETDARIRALDLSRDELEDLADLTEQLHSSPLFRRLSLGELAWIVEAGTVCTVERGETLIREGDRDRIMYVVLDGQLRVWETNRQGRRQLLGYHYPGDFTGEMIMVEGDARLANVDAVEDSRVIAFGEEGWARISTNTSLVNLIRKAGPERVQENTYPFEGKQLDEVIVERAHRSWIALVRRALVPILGIVLSLTLISVLLSSTNMNVRSASSVGLAIVVAMLLWFLWMWQDWRNDDFIVTSKRVIRVERFLIPPFPVERQEAAIQMIQDIRTTKQGLWTLLFGVKTVLIGTMGAGTIRFPDLRDAEAVREKIFMAQKHARSRTEIPNHKQINRRIAEELGFEVKEVEPLDSQPAGQVEQKKKRGEGLLGYFVPYTRIEEPGVVTWRRHWLFMVSRVFLPFVSFLAALALTFLPVTVQPGWMGGRVWLWMIPGVILTLVSIGWYLWRYEGWRNDIYQVTDSRIIDIEGSPFHLRKETRTEGTFDVIQNVTYDSPNLFYRWLRIGFVTIDTAAEQRAYTFDWVGHPDQVQQEIFARWTAYREREKEAATRRRQQEFLEWIVEYDRLVRQGGS